MPTQDAMTPVGIDIHAVTSWYLDNVEGALPPLRFTLVPGGRSNLTFVVHDARETRTVLRRPPTSHVLATAHDMEREARILIALGPTDVPVPTVYGLCTDVEVTGAPFYVMSFAEGTVVRDQDEAERTFSIPMRAGIGDHLADTLTQLHAVDIDAVGLGDFARRDGYVARQLKRWSAQFEQMAAGGAPRSERVVEVGAALADANPEDARAANGVRATIVHGDYRLDNVVLDPSGRVAAILDWEICTLGDPLADVGLLLDYWTEPEDSPILGSLAPTAAPGFARRADVLARYADRSGRDVTDVNFFRAFGYWKLACVLQGVYARYVAGASAGDPGSVEAFPRTVERLARMAADTLADR